VMSRLFSCEAGLGVYGIATYCEAENKVSLGFVEDLSNKIRVVSATSVWHM
jgi:hypothetical protein